MKALLTLETRFELGADGFPSNPLVSANHWEPYLAHFQSIEVLARIKGSEAIRVKNISARDDRVVFIPLPYYEGPLGFIRNYRHIRDVIRRRVHECDVLIARLPSMLGDEAVREARRTTTPYAALVVGDPDEVFSKGVVNHPLRLPLRSIMKMGLRTSLKGACAVNFVSLSTLAEKYPPPRTAYVSSFTDVHLPPEAFVSAPRQSDGSDMTIITVGSLDQMYKGVDTLLEATARCLPLLHDLRVEVVGDGRYRPALERQAHVLGIADRVRFYGAVPAGEAVRKILDRGTVFVLASRTEGLPRAMIEAMARGLPCIGTNVGGIPELITTEYLVPRDDPKSLAKKLVEVLTDSDQMVEMSATNLERAASFKSDVMGDRRTRFFQHLYDQAFSLRERKN